MNRERACGWSSGERGRAKARGWIEDVMGWCRQGGASTAALARSSGGGKVSVEELGLGRSRDGSRRAMMYGASIHIYEGPMNRDGKINLKPPLPL